MITVLHLADVHLGAKFVSLGKKGVEQRKKLAEAFRKTPQIAAEKNAKLVLIAGDLFDNPQPAQANIDLLNEVLKELTQKGIAVAISAGTHDYLGAGSVFLTGAVDDSHEDVFIFKEPKPTTHVFSKLGVAVSARSLDSNKAHKSPLEGLQPDPQVKINIAMAHGSVETPGLKIPKDDWVISAEQLKSESSKFQYIALGHWHGAKEVVKGKCWYSGSPEWLGLDQKGSGNMLLVEVNEQGAKVEQIPVGSTKFDNMEIDIAAIENREQLAKKLVEGADRSMIRVVTLKGVRADDLTLDYRQLEEEYGGNFWHLRVVDNTVVKTPVIEGKEKTLTNEYLKLMQKKLDKADGEAKKNEIEEASWVGAKLLLGKEAGI